MAIHRGIRIQQYLDDWLVRATSHQACLQYTQSLVKICQKLGWLVNLDKSELDPKQIFNFVDYQFDLRAGRVRPTPDRWQNLQDKILEIMSLPNCPVRQFMSLIGLLTATEKQVHLGRLHMRPIQWHLKQHWRIPESLEKVIPIPSSLHPHLQWWLQEDNVLTGQPLHPIKHALQIFTDASKEGWGAHLNEFTARGTWSLPESKLHMNYLELKAVFLVEKLQGSPCKRIILIAPGWPNMPWFWDLVTMSSQIPLSLQPAQPVDTTFQSDPSQKSDKPKSPCMAPRATAIKEQGFSEAVATRIEAPQRGSTRSVYEAKWAIFTKWCITNQVDFRAPPVKSVADFLMYLFEDRKLQSSTIDAYRSAIADKLGNSTLNISKDENLTHLLDSFHRDRPKGRRGIPSWNLSLVLHQLTKAPFEPIKEASLTYLTFKTVFLLALGSGKCRSEIHAWQHRNIRHQSDWSKVSLYPSPSFLSKNQLAKEGPDCVAPVVIPSLAPTLDRSLKSDRSLCPVRALRYYLDRTSDLRQNKKLVFVSFKKGFNKDISPATISSWIKQTMSYELSDQEAHTLHQVKAHDVRAFAASKAFQSGISLEQILSACHWKSYNTFTQFYLKDVAWADSELYHLGPVVAAQQIHK